MTARALSANLSFVCALRFETGVSQRWWTWLVCTPSEWAQSPVKNVNQPLLVAFFACIGLNASGSLVKRGSPQVGLFLGLALALAVLQYLVGGMPVTDCPGCVMRRWCWPASSSGLG